MKQSRVPVETTFQEVKVSKNVTVGGRHPYKVITRWTDPATKKESLFASDSLWYDSSSQINREKITVYVDRGNPKIYIYMDIAFLYAAPAK